MITKVPGMQAKGFSFNGSKTLINLGLIALGSLIFVIGMNGILVPQGFLSGGVVGISLWLSWVGSISAGALCCILFLAACFFR